jgi:hypothetical protein
VSGINGTSGTSGAAGTSGISFSGTSGISGGTFTNQPNYLVYTTGASTVQSVSFLSISGTVLQVGGTVKTNALTVDDPGTAPAGANPPVGGGGIDRLITNTANDTDALGEPDIWLRITISGTNYVFPGYTEP